MGEEVVAGPAQGPVPGRAALAAKADFAAAYALRGVEATRPAAGRAARRAALVDTLAVLAGVAGAARATVEVPAAAVRERAADPRVLTVRPGQAQLIAERETGGFGAAADAC